MSNVMILSKVALEEVNPPPPEVNPPCLEGGRNKGGSLARIRPDDKLPRLRRRHHFTRKHEDELEIYGNFSTDSNSHIEFLMLPCNTLFREWGYEGDTVADECIWDL